MAVVRQQSFAQERHKDDHPEYDYQGGRLIDPSHLLSNDSTEAIRIPGITTVDGRPLLHLLSQSLDLGY
jgi:hypothetical protein